MQHLIDNHQLIIDNLKQHPFMAFVISVVGTGLGYAIGETHIPLWMMQICQIFAWSSAGLAGLVPVTNWIKTVAIPWYKNNKNG